MDLFTSPGGLNNTEALFSSMTRLDSVFVPGGDGGEVLVPSDMLKVVSQVRDSVGLYWDAQIRTRLPVADTA